MLLSAGVATLHGEHRGLAIRLYEMLTGLHPCSLVLDVRCFYLLQNIRHNCVQQIINTRRFKHLLNRKDLFNVMLAAVQSCRGGLLRLSKNKT